MMHFYGHITQVQCKSADSGATSHHGTNLVFEKVMLYFYSEIPAEPLAMLDLSWIFLKKERNESASIAAT